MFEKEKNGKKKEKIMKSCFFGFFDILRILSILPITYE